MSTFSANPFALLAEEGDSPAPTTVVKKGVASTPQPAKTIPGQPAKKSVQISATQTSRAPRRQAGGTEREAPLGGESTNRDDRGDRRGRGGYRGDRGGFRGRGRGKNDRLDRHSATGTQDTEKRIASGWGADEGKSALQAENEAESDAKAEPAPDTPVANGAEEEVVVADVVQEEEDKTKTLDEYFAERATVSVNPEFHVREANEGTDESQWKDGVELIRTINENEDFFAGKSKKSATTTTKKQIKEKVTLDVEPQSYRSPRDNRGGGDRGAGRGRGSGRGRGDGSTRGSGSARGGRGGSRGGSYGAGSRAGGFDAADPSAFPSLS